MYEPSSGFEVGLRRLFRPRQRPAGPAWLNFWLRIEPAIPIGGQARFGWVGPSFFNHDEDTVPERRAAATVCATMKDTIGGII